MMNLVKVIMISGLIMICCVACGGTINNEAGNIANNTTNNVEALGVDVFNAQFKNYVGTNARGTIVKNLINKVITNNQIDANMVSVEFKGLTSIKNATSDIEELEVLLDSIEIGEARYDVEITGYSKKVVSKITITQTIENSKNNENVSGD